MKENPVRKIKDYSAEFGPTGFDSLIHYDDFKLPLKELGARTILHEDTYARVELVKFCNGVNHWLEKTTTDLVASTIKGEVDSRLEKCNCHSSSDFLITK